MKRGYETVLIVDAMLPEEQIESTVTDVEKFLSGKSEVKKVDRLGRRKLAYRINKKTHGFYAVVSFDGEGEVIPELDRRLRLNEKVLRFMTVLREGEEPEADKVKVEAENA